MKSAPNILNDFVRRLRSVILRGIVRVVDDSAPLQIMQVQGLASAISANIEHLQPFGFSSNPPLGAEVLTLSIGAAPGHLVSVLATDRRYRIRNLASGEAILFNQWGDYIKLHADHTIEVFSQNQVTVNATNNVNVTAPNVNVNASTKVTLTTPLVECTQNMKVDGNLEVDGTSNLKGAVTAEAPITAPTVIGSTDVVVGPSSKSLAAHVHTGVSIGGSDTGEMA